MRRILVIITAVTCLCGCEKDEMHWLYGYWYGEYDEYMIGMEFSADGSECTVTTAFTNGNLGMNKVTYCVYVNEQYKSFFMNKGPVWSSELDYSGYLSDGKIIISIWPERDDSTITSVCFLNSEAAGKHALTRGKSANYR